MFPRLLLLLCLIGTIPGTLVACRTTDPAPEGTADVTAEPASPEPVGADEPRSTSLVVWTVPRFAPLAEDETPTPFGEAIESYRQSNPDLTVDVSVKPADGPQGMLAHLVSTNQVVQSELPDVAIVPLSIVSDTIAAGIAQPIVSESLVTLAFDAFPFAAERAGDTQGVARAVPFAADVLHAIAREELPSKWEDAGPDWRLVAAAGHDTIETTAIVVGAYAAAGGSISTLPVVSEEALSEALEALYEAREAQLLELDDGASNGQDAWSVFLDQSMAAAAVDGGSFVWHQGNFPALIWGPVPGADRTAPPIAWGWAYIVTSQDDGRRADAEALVEHLTDAANNEWVLHADLLPAWPDAWRTTVAAVVEPTPAPEYLDFLVDQLIRADSVDSVDLWGAAWSSALSLLANGGSVEDALQSIVSDDD